jgi:hypothetical protein
MNERIEERKKQIADYYEKEYAPQLQKWWWAKPEKKYESTREVYERTGGLQHHATETIIKNDKKGAAVTAALFLLASIPIWINPVTWKRADGILCLLFLYAIVILLLINFLDRRPKIILDARGICTHQWEGAISWENIAAVYIREDSSGDSSDYYLLEHYYNTETDEFLSAEYSLGGLEESPDRIACFVQQQWMNDRTGEQYLSGNDSLPAGNYTSHQFE